VVDTLWSDVSEFQIPVDNRYPHQFLCFRSNDGSYEDHHFPQNLAWARGAVHSGKLWGFMVYYFYRPGFNGAGLLMQRVGHPDPKLTVMIDVESAGGQIGGNQSAAINAQYEELARWLGDKRRVVGYGNTSDLNALWPQKPQGIRLVVAAYGSNPSYPGKFAHQFMDNANTPPFGSSDLNSADGMSQADLENMFGLTYASPPHHSTAPAQVARPFTTTQPKPGGPYRHVLTQATSMKELAALRNSQVLTVWTHMVQNVTQTDLDAEQDAKMPVGWVFYTSNE
jgi:hypothetical protein